MSHLDSQGDNHFQHDLLQEFSLGKNIQKIPSHHHECIISQPHLIEKYFLLKYKPIELIQTSLSPNVHKLVCHNKRTPHSLSKISVQTTETTTFEKCTEITSDSKANAKLNVEILKMKTLDNSHQLFVLDWNFFTKDKLLGGRTDLLNDKTSQDEMFVIAASYIQFAAQTIHNHFFVPRFMREKLDICGDETNPCVSKFFEMYPKSLFCLYSQQIVLDSIITTHTNGDSLLSFMIAVSFMEQGLQDVVCSYFASQNRKNDIKMFNDKLPKFSELLEMDELKQLLGDDIVFLMKAFVGRLNSLNLRNITLHGFIAPHEFPPAYTSLMILLIVSISDLLSNHPSIPNIIHRPVSQLNEMNSFGGICILDEMKLLDQSKACENRPTFLEEVHLDERIAQLLDHSYFVIPAFKSYWIKSLKYFITGQFLECLYLLFPILEHSIRRIFVCCNGCGERLITAEKDSYYTTLDILLSTIPSSYLQKQENQIFDELGITLSNALFDLLVWTDGPRVRDLLCHGNINPKSISKSVVDRAMITALYACIQFDIRNKKHLQNNSYYMNQCLHPELVKVHDYFTKHYEPIFHPKNRLIMLFQSVHADIQSFYTFVKPHFGSSIQDVNEEGISDVAIEFVTKDLDSIVGYYLQKMKGVALLDHDSITQSKNIKHDRRYTVVMGPKEVKKLLLLSKIITICKEICLSITETVEGLVNMIKHKKAKKRHRQSYVYYCRYCNVFHLVLQLMLFVCISEFMSDSIQGKELINNLALTAFGIHGAIISNKPIRAFELSLALIYDLGDDAVFSGLKYQLVLTSRKEAKKLYINFSKIMEESSD